MIFYRHALFSSAVLLIKPQTDLPMHFDDSDWNGSQSVLFILAEIEKIIFSQGFVP